MSRKRFPWSGGGNFYYENLAIFVKSAIPITLYIPTGYEKPWLCRTLRAFVPNNLYYYLSTLYMYLCDSFLFISLCAWAGHYFPEKLIHQN